MPLVLQYISCLLSCSYPIQHPAWLKKIALPFFLMFHSFSVQSSSIELICGRLMFSDNFCCCCCLVSMLFPLANVNWQEEKAAALFSNKRLMLI